MLVLVLVAEVSEGEGGTDTPLPLPLSSTTAAAAAAEEEEEEEDEDGALDISAYVATAAVMLASPKWAREAITIMDTNFDIVGVGGWGRPNYCR